jgi:PTS system nitrogen regulatory IIA component
MDKIMTTKEVAEYIKLNEKTVIKMAQEGKLPGMKLSNKWRFQLSAIDHYLQSEIVSSSDDDLNSIIQTADTVIPLSRLISPELISLDTYVKDKHDLLQYLAGAAFKGGIVRSSETLFEQLVKREDMLSTGIGQGIALPHPRNPRIGFILKPQIVIMRTSQPIAFEAPDDLACDLFFLICAPNAYVHVRLLAKVAKFLHKNGNIAGLRKAGTLEEFMQVFLRYERDQIALYIKSEE